MSRHKLPSIALATLVAAGCGTGGLDYWLYPEPHLAEPEEALFVVHPSHQLQSIDGEETAARCWGDRSQPEGYRLKDVLCRLHILPGRHSVVFQPSVTSRESVRLEFTALPGKAYGLVWSSCTTTSDGRQETCRVEVVEIEKPAEGG